MKNRKRGRYRLRTYGNWLRMIANWALHLLARNLPGSINLRPTLRPFLHRLRGVKIYGYVFIGDDVYIDEDFPEAIEIHDGAVIAPRCTIIGHTKGPGRVIIEKQAAIGAACVIVCASGQTLTIGEGAVISAGSTVSHDIPPHTLCGAPRIQAFGTITVPFTLDTAYEDFKRGVRPLRPPKSTHADCPRKDASAGVREEDGCC